MSRKTWRFDDNAVHVCLTLDQSREPRSVVGKRAVRLSSKAAILTAEIDRLIARIRADDDSNQRSAA